MGVGGNYMWQWGKKFVADRAIWKVSLGGPSKALVGTQPPYSTLRGSQKIKIWIFDFFVSIAAGAGFGTGSESITKKSILRVVSSLRHPQNHRKQIFLFLK